MTKVTLNGFDELAKALEGAERAFIPIASAAIAKALETVYEVIAPYPPQPARDRSSHFNTYVRGIGIYPRSAFIADSTQPGGYRTRKTKKAEIKHTSEQMDKKWRMSVALGSDRVTGTLQNDASYSGWVSGPKEGDPHQVPWHALTGWTNEDDAIEQATPLIEKCVDEAVDEYIKRITA